MGEHQLLGDRDVLGDPGVAEDPLDRVLLGVRHPAEGLEGLVGGLPADLGAGQLGDVGLVAAGPAPVEEPGGW